MPVRGRMLSASISQSRKFARLDNHGHRLMYVLLLPHVDCEGRHDAEAAILAGKCYTSLGFTADEILTGLGDMANVGLIRLYEAHGDMFLEVVDFLDYQTIRRKANGEPVREAPSKIPSWTECRTTAAVVTQDRGSSAAELPADVRQDRGSADPGEIDEEPSSTSRGRSAAEVRQSSSSSAAMSAAQSNKILGAAAPKISTPELRSRPGGRARPAAVDDYLNRQKAREKTPAELAVERLVPKAEA